MAFTPFCMHAGQHDTTSGRRVFWMAMTAIALWQGWHQWQLRPVQTAEGPLRAFEITQSARFYSWRPKAALPIPRQDVIEHSANTHVIPADSTVGAQLARLREGQVVHLTGLLVDGVRDDGSWIRTSLTRSDTGAGACEIMLVEHAETL